MHGKNSGGDILQLTTRLRVAQQSPANGVHDLTGLITLKKGTTCKDDFCPNQIAEPNSIQKPRARATADIVYMKTIFCNIALYDFKHPLIF